MYFNSKFDIRTLGGGEGGGGLLCTLGSKHDQPPSDHCSKF